MIVRRIALAALGVGLLGLAGCVPSVLPEHARDDSAQDLAKAVALEGSPQGGPVNGTGHPLAFLVTVAPRKLVAFDLTARKVLWSVPAETESRVVVGPRGVYAALAGGRLGGFDAASGTALFAVAIQPSGGQILGLAADGARVYVALQATEKGQRVSHLLALDATTGHLAWDRPAPGSLGAPAVRGGALFVPYLSQYVSILDTTTGEEVARLRIADTEIDFVRALPEGLYYGATGVFTLDDRSIAGTKNGSTYVEANLPPFVRPVYALNGYDPKEADYTAYDRSRLLWRGSTNGKPGFANGLVVVQNYRYLFGFAAETGALDWAFSSPADLVSARATGPAVAYATAEGEVGLIDVKSGATLTLGTIGQRLQGGTFDADGLAATGVTAPAPLEQVLTGIVWDADSRFTQVKLFAIDALARLPGKEVSADLLKIVENPKIVPAIYDRAGSALVARHDASALPLYLRDLAIRWDYIAGTEPHAVGVLARAVGALGAKEAVPSLVAQLDDPSTPSADLALVAEGLTQIGGRAALPTFRTFLLEYRADPLFQSDPAPLGAVVDGLLSLGGPEERALLRYVEADGRTLPKLRAYLDKALSQGPPTASPASKPAAAAAETSAAD